MAARLTRSLKSKTVVKGGFGIFVGPGQTEDQIQPECMAFNELALAVYRDFGFDDVVIKLALRPDKRLGEDAAWDRAV